LNAHFDHDFAQAFHTRAQQTKIINSIKYKASRGNESRTWSLTINVWVCFGRFESWNSRFGMLYTDLFLYWASKSSTNTIGTSCANSVDCRHYFLRMLHDKLKAINCLEIQRHFVIWYILLQIQIEPVVSSTRCAVRRIFQDRVIEQKQMKGQWYKYATFWNGYNNIRQHHQFFLSSQASFILIFCFR